MRMTVWLAMAVVMSGLVAEAKGATSSGSPKQDAAFERFTKPLDNDLQRAVRALTLANVLARNCRGASLNRSVLAHTIAASRISTASSSDVDLAFAVVTPDFSFFDDDALVHLCRRIDDLFGPRGIIAPGLVTRGTGTLIRPPDPGNPFLSVEMLPKRHAP